MFTPEQFNLLLGPFALTVALLGAAFVLWRAHTAADKALIAAEKLRGDEWKVQTDVKVAEVAKLTDSVDKLTAVVEAALVRLAERRATR